MLPGRARPQPIRRSRLVPVPDGRGATRAGRCAILGAGGVVFGSGSPPPLTYDAPGEHAVATGPSESQQPPARGPGVRDPCGCTGPATRGPHPSIASTIAPCSASSPGVAARTVTAFIRATLILRPSLPLGNRGRRLISQIGKRWRFTDPSATRSRCHDRTRTRVSNEHGNDRRPVLIVEVIRRGTSQTVRTDTWPECP